MSGRQSVDSKAKKQLIARIDPSLHAAITMLANVQGLTLTDYVERALRNDLAKRTDAPNQLRDLAEQIDQFQRGQTDELEPLARP